jgi:hypothetical protein
VAVENHGGVFQLVPIDVNERLLVGCPLRINEPDVLVGYPSFGPRPTGRRLVVFPTPFRFLLRRPRDVGRLVMVFTRLDVPGKTRDPGAHLA